MDDGPSGHWLFPLLVTFLLLAAGCLGDGDDEEEKKDYDATVQFLLMNLADDSGAHKIRVSIIDLTRDANDKDSCSQAKDYTVQPFTGEMDWIDVEVFVGNYTLNFYDYTADNVHETGVNLTEASPVKKVTLYIYSGYMVTTIA